MAPRCLRKLLVDGTRLELVTSALRTRPVATAKSSAINNLDGSSGGSTLDHESPVKQHSFL